MSEGYINIIIVDDHELVRDGLELMLMNQNSFKILGTASDYRELDKILESQSADIILLDIDLPAKSGIEITKSLKGNKNAPKIIMLTSNDQIFYLEKALKAGADGFLSKSSKKEVIVESIQQVMLNHIFVDHNLSQDVYMSLKNRLDLHQDDNELSEREIEIIKGFANGSTYQQIGEALNISKKTVETHKSTIFKKLNLSNNADLVKYAIKHAYVELN